MAHTRLGHEKPWMHCEKCGFEMRTMDTKCQNCSSDLKHGPKPESAHESCEDFKKRLQQEANVRAYANSYWND